MTVKPARNSEFRIPNSALLPVPAAQDSADGVVILQHQEVSALAYLDGADLILQPDLPGGGHGGGVNGVFQGGRGKIAEVADRFPHGQGTARDGTVVGAGLAVLHGDGVARNAVLAVGTARGLHGVGDEGQVCGTLCKISELAPLE